MPDYRKLQDKDFIASWDLRDDAGRAIEVVVTITKVEQGEVRRRPKKGEPKDAKQTKRAPILSFRGTNKRLVAIDTHCKEIARLYGKATEGWVGKRLTLYGSTCTLGRETVDCVRIRPTVPGSTAPDTRIDAPVTVQAELEGEPTLAASAPSSSPSASPT